MVRTGLSRDSNQGSVMCQAPASSRCGVADLDSDDGLKWEDFFGPSVEISSSLLGMFDSLAAKNSAVNSNRSVVEDPCYPLIMGSSSPGDPGGTKDPQSKPLPEAESGQGGNRRPVRGFHRKGRSYSDSAFQEKKRPLSTSSVSSSSSSSSSSLPRNGLEVKRSYLASIESLDDVVSEDSNSAVRSATGTWEDAKKLTLVDKVILEIVETEKTYVLDLRAVIQGYLKHISNAHHSKVSYKSLMELFSNIEDIHDFNSFVLEDLNKCGLDPVAVARCFVRHGTGFEIYTDYCTNYPRTVSVLTELMGNPETAEIFKERQAALQHSFSLGSYLLKPVQRILKYHLILQNLLKYCDKESEAYSDIKNALTVMTGIACHMNDMKRKHEHAVRVQEIQSLLYGWEGEDLTTYGELVAESTFKIHRAKASRHLCLFDKMLLIVKKKQEGILSYKTHILCSNLMLVESIKGERLCFHVIPFDNPRHQYTFQARNDKHKREWCLQLKEVMLENYNAVIPSHARQLVMELGESRQEDSGLLEKSSTRKQLSHPEYLEKRKQERKKSELNATRAGSKSKKGVKKNEMIPNGKNYFAGRRKSPSMETQSNDNISVSSRESWASQPDNYCWTKSQNDVNNSSNHRTRSFSSSKESVSECHSSSGPASFNRDSKLRHSLPEPSLSHRSAYKSFRFRHAWRAWNSVPEETTDTENDDVTDSVVDVKRILALRPSSRSLRNRSYRENTDPSDEYVTFFCAHKYACRNLPVDGVDPSAVESEPDSQRCRDELEVACLTASNPSLSKRGNHRKQKIQDKLKNSNDKYTCNDGTNNMWVRPKDSHSKDHNSGHSWRQSAAIRRVQSFTGMAKAKVANLHHNFSFRHHSNVCGEAKLAHKHSSDMPVGSPALPSNMEDISPTTPAAWLQNQEEHLANSDKKSGSLPRSFQLSTEMMDSTSESNIHCLRESDNSHRLRIRMDGHRNAYNEQRPFTIASDKPSQADFLEGIHDYVELLPGQGCDKHFLSHKDSYELDTTTDCTNTPAVSMENVNFIHPEHKIYHQAASKYSTLRHVISNVGSKIAGLKATLSNPLTHDHADSCSNISVDSDYTRNDAGQCNSQTSLRSNNELSPKIFTSKFAHSVAKAYSSVVKHKLKKADSKCGRKSFEGGKQEKSPLYKSEISVIGARMAHPLESEYSVPKTLLNNLRKGMEISESANRLSSSVNKQESSLKYDEGEDTVSDASESSADSYYERTFDAIENALAEDMFRDSAIYSDPEDADFSAVETPLSINAKNNYMSRSENGDSCCVSPTSPQLELTCKKGVNKAIIQRLKILEENIKYKSEDISLFENPKTLTHHKLEAEKWCLGDFEESETSSEHSASTVNTVMELGNCVSKSVTNLNKTRTQPRIKGWVKHVVDKLQGENHV